MLGAAAALGGAANALERRDSGDANVAREAELGLIRFRVAAGRLKDAALPAVRQPVAATELLDSRSRVRCLARRRFRPRTRLVTSRAVAPEDPPLAALAEALADAARTVAVLRGESDDLPAGLVAELPGPIARLCGALTLDDPIFRRALRLAAAAGLAGLIAALFDLTRIYWAVFAAVVVLNAPPARDLPRAIARRSAQPATAGRTAR